jgi:hypothetical protein
MNYLGGGALSERRFFLKASHKGNSVQTPGSDNPWLGHSHLIVAGTIAYADLNDARRSLSFLRRYDPESGRFEVVDDPYYEYAD